jgi:hypothetical protein
MSKCSKCNVPWSADSFYKSNRTTCKSCVCAAVRKRRRENPAVQSYERERAKLPHRRQRATLAVARWRREHPDLYRAQNAINNGIRDGKLHRRPCDTCGKSRNVFGIPADPEKPIEAVKWRCALYHHRARFQAKEMA